MFSPPVERKKKKERKESEMNHGPLYIFGDLFRRKLLWNLSVVIRGERNWSGFELPENY